MKQKRPVAHLANIFVGQLALMAIATPTAIFTSTYCVFAVLQANQHQIGIMVIGVLAIMLAAKN